MLEVESKDLLTEMRDSRDTTNVAFIKFTSCYKYFNSHKFCFFEGEDGKYYNQRIKRIVGDNIIPITSGNKENTLKLWRKLKKDSSYKNVVKMFFVDKDMDDKPDDIDDDLYITPCYSIENLYVNKATLQNILESEFSINRSDEDYARALNLFESMYRDFCNEMIEFNALVLLRKEKGLNGGKVNISTIKTGNLIYINLSTIQKSTKYDTTINTLKEQLCVEENDIQQAIKKLEEQGNYSENFRGKNQLDFFVKFLHILKNENSNGTFFEYKRKTVSIHLTNNRLSELSQYALTPQSLVSFLSKHKIS